IYEHNSYATGRHDGRGLGFVLRNEAGQMIGVAAGFTWSGTCELKQIWIAQHRLLPSHRAVAQTSSLRQNQKPSSLRFDGGGPMAVTMRNRMALTRRAVMKSTVATAAWSVIGGIACPSLSFAPDRPQITHGIQSGDVSTGSGVVWARADRPARMLVEVAT